MQRYVFFLTVMAQNYLMDCQLYKFHYINENKTWTEAQQYCRENHTDLATVTNMKDMERLISVSLGDIKEAWIGLYDQRNVNRTWYWSLPGVEFKKSETNWAPGEPNNLGSEGQNCGIIWKDDSNFLKWADLSCNEKHNFTCYYVYFAENDSSQKYFLIKELKTWLEAQSYCRDKHTDLISGTNGEVNKGLHLMTANSRYIFIGLFRDTWRWSDGNSSSFRHQNAQFASTDHVWIGLSYACTLDLWFWVSDEMVRYSNSAQNELMDDCDMSGAMETGGEYKWFKRNDAEKFNFICTKNRRRE
ncbi:C-type mannose receptor 2-like [Xiphophorus couchianus]|uniref:C-type mannose receptor 2-like n=1 Tax=Xiphophorus couchianus TaxID=32473 RepID=UPI001015E538|nr:C-type mannose receptor 2-like [Xiphophorus couchianus]